MRKVLLISLLAVLLISLLALLIGGLLVYLYLQSKVRVEPEAPAFTSFEGYPQAELSTLVFPLSIAISDISQKINETLESKPIHLSIPIDDGKGVLEMNIEFYDLIKLKWNSQKLSADVPIHIAASAYPYCGNGNYHKARNIIDK